MRRARYGVAVGLVLALALGFLSPGGGAPAPVGPPLLVGRVSLKGPRPNLKMLTESLRRQIDVNPDKACCLKGTAEETSQQIWKIDAKGGVGNVFVWISPIPGSHFEVSEVQRKAAKAHPVVIDQPHCAFLPHCVVLFPMYHDGESKKLRPTGQTLIVKNTASISHNTKWESPQSTNSKTIPSGEDRQIPGIRPFKPSNEPIHIMCDIHKWMDAWALVVESPFATITKPDGSYTINGVPKGVKVRLFAWHEMGGYLNRGGPKGEEITLRAGANVMDFEVRAGEER